MRYTPETTSSRNSMRAVRAMERGYSPTTCIQPFIKTFQESLQGSKTVPMNWSKAIEVISSKRSLQELGDYWRLLWELAAACPLPYLNASVLPKSLIAHDHERLKKYGFKINIDGIELAKPVRLQNNPGGYTTHFIEEQTQ